MRPNARLTATERVGVYQGMYLLRMVEALAALLGHARFHALVAAYVTAHPSRSYTLNRLGDALPDDLAARARHPREHALADLARLEHAIGTAFDAAPAERLDAAAVAEASAGGWEALRLQPQPGLRLVRTRTDPGVALDALRAGERVRTPPRRWTHTVVFRVGDDAARERALFHRGSSYDPTRSRRRRLHLLDPREPREQPCRSPSLAQSERRPLPVRPKRPVVIDAEAASP